MNRPYPLFFMAHTVFPFFLFHYSVWQREDPNRSSLPFSETQFFQDFFTQTLYYLDPFITSLILLMAFWVLCSNIIESKRMLYISDEHISWVIFGYRYKTVVRCQDIQQIQYIEIPPKDKNQTVLLRFKTHNNEYDLKLSDFDEVNQNLILEQLSQYQVDLLQHQNNRYSQA
ncbi:hypothetical protein BS636_02005 [Acinetobacter sp. LoGeW2-3]|nr:hypothetical protein BS636_02005 [Acinetobacter sp. LoGeW2-3]